MNRAKDKLTFTTAETERMRIDNAGNVGIGTTSPDARLEVIGQVKITGGSLAFSDGSVQTTAAPVPGMFPRPAYDSGWVDIGIETTIALSHNLGGNLDNYVVDLTFKDKSNGVVSNKGLGWDEFYEGSSNIKQMRGYYWKDITSSHIHVTSGTYYNRQVRVRIWVYN